MKSVGRERIENLNPLRILHLEDNQLDAELVRTTLEGDGIGCEATRVETREGFEAALEEGGFDLILADHSLPSFDGFSALEIARNTYPDLPFILVSGAIGEESAVEAMRNGATDYVLKHRLERIGPAVRRAVRETEERRERKRAEEKYRSIFENAVDGIFQSTVEGRLLTANPAMARIFGYDSPEEMMEAVSNLERLYVESGLWAEFLNLIRQHGTASNFETQMYCKDGSVIWISTNARAVYDKDNDLAGFEGTLEDVTKRKEAEEALDEVKEAERGRIARDLHDVVLQDLSYALQTVQSSRDTPSDEDQNAEMDEVVEALRRSVSGLRNAVYDLRPAWTGEGAFAHSVEYVVNLNRQMNPGCEIELEIDEDFPEKLPEKTGRELLRILQEALANVRRHSGAGHVLVALGAAGDRLRAEVSDDGRGFDPEKPGGMGTRGMRERALVVGGDLQIMSRPGEGTKVRLEMSPKEAGQGLVEKEPEEEARVLLVEDHTSFRQAVASVLEREPGFTVVGQAESLAEARRVLARSGEESINIGILDLGLPDGYGGDLIKELRAGNPRAQVLVLSASLNHEEIARAVENGAAGVLHKSASMDEILDAVQRLRAGETLLPLEEVVELLRFVGSRRGQEHEAHQAIAQLTDREKEVLRALAEGLDGPEIAKRLRISEKTERNHVASIFTKLGVHSRLQALVFALRHGVVELPH